MTAGARGAVGDRLVSLFVVGLVGAVVGGTAASGQEVDVPRLPIGYRVRLLTTTDTLQGRWMEPEGGALRIADEASVTSVDARRVRGIELQTTRAKRGAFLGAAVGAAVGGLYLGILAEGLCEVDCEGPGEFFTGLVLGGGLGAGAGGMVGLVLGSWTLSWRPVWP